MKKHLLLLIIGLVTGALSSYGQCPTITCPGDTVIISDSGSCSATFTYTAPQGTNPCMADTVTFTNCNVTGRTGPTQTDVNNAYSGTSLAGQVTINTQGIQEWKVPANATYTIIAAGAKGGGTNGGQGAIMQGDFTFNQGETIKILVGQQGTFSTSGRYDFSGGGGTFVTDSVNTAYIVAGGGGGAEAAGSGSAGQTTTAGNGGTGGYSNGAGGTGGSGGTYVNQTTDGGAGITGDGGSGNPNPAPQAFINGGEGGCNTWSTGCGMVGGFGGGGASNRNSTTYHGAGGGGGYSGGGSAYGNGSNLPIAGGGGSFNGGTNQNNTAGANAGHGYVTITWGTTTATPTTNQVAGLSSGSTFPEGTTVNTFVVDDGLGNTDTCSFNVTVISNINTSVAITGNGNELTALNDSAGVTYQWIDCSDSSAISGAMNQSFKPSQNGSYAVIVSQNSCSDTSSCYSITNAGMEQYANTNGVSVYPNPTAGEVTVDFKKAPGEAVITVEDIHGRMIETTTVNNQTKAKLDINDDAGIYIIRIQTDKGIDVMRVMKN